MQPLLAPGASPFTIMGHPFSRSYGAILPSSLTWFISRTLGYSPRLPVSVCGTDTLSSTPRSFSRQHSISKSHLSEDSWSLRLSDFMAGGFSYQPSCGLRPSSFHQGGNPIPTGRLTYCVPPSAPIEWYRNINLLSIDYAFRPRLRFRLTLGGRTLP